MAVTAAHTRRGPLSNRWQGGGVAVDCRTCGTRFTAHRYRVRAGYGHYCSKTCYRQGHSAGDQQKERLPSTCQICGKVTYHQPYWAKRRKFCSRRCTAIHAARCVHERTLGGRSTWIEDALEALLLALGVPYEKQKPMLGLTLVDFFVAPDLVIYTDGTYWHGSPKKKAQDAYVTRQLRKAGYRVLRFAEATIEQDCVSVGVQLANEVRQCLQNR